MNDTPDGNSNGAIPVEEIKALLDRWCDRREYKALHHVLNGWFSINGLSDGWAILRDSLRTAYAFCPHLPADERELLKTYYVQMDIALRNTDC